MGTSRSPFKDTHGLIDYLLKNKQGCIIFTTRDRKVAVKLAQQNVVELSELKQDRRLKT
jgi:hypothetical protein